MYYRRKILLALIEKNGGKLEKFKLHNQLMLLSEKQTEPAYYFVPCNYGCISFQANQDLSTMKKYAQTSETPDEWSKIDYTSFYDILKSEDRKILDYITDQFSQMSLDELLYHIFNNYPYYAINSDLAETILPEHKYETVKSLDFNVKEKTLFTIGYEGISSEEYFNLLIRNGVKVLCDVRRNPVSMKFGFSKKQLESACKNLGLQYFHFPALGISADKREAAAAVSDYQRIFIEYKNTTLIENKNDQDIIVKLIEANSAVALTCFEADQNNCHRSRLAESLTKLPSWKYKLIHLSY